MALLIVAIYSCFYCMAIHRMIATGRTIWFHLGLLGLFSIGYYVLPVVLTPSYFAAFDAEDLVTILLLHGLYHSALAFGIGGGVKAFSAKNGLCFSHLDSWFIAYRRQICIVSFILYLVCVSLYAQTSYASDDVYAYFTEPRMFIGMLSGISGLLLASLAFGFAVEIRRGWTPFAWALVAGLFAIVGASLSLAQRLATVTPLAMVLTALFITRQKARAIASMCILLAVLVLVSPFAVYMRESQMGTRGADRTLSTVREFSFGENAITTSVESILNRADLLGNSIKLKDYIDSHGYVGWIYYYSAIVSPIPRIVIPAKPYPLSYDGTLWGHLSVIAWAIDWGRPGNVGSLTAFGGITAYSQGGWIAVVLDGLAAGMLFVFLARWLANGATIGKVLYIQLLPNLAIKRVPPSFFEALIEFLPLLLGICALQVLEVVLRTMTDRPRFRRFSRGRRAMAGMVSD